MTDKITIDSGTPEEVAFKLWNILRTHKSISYNDLTQDDLFDLYDKCLRATKGYPLEE